MAMAKRPASAAPAAAATRRGSSPRAPVVFAAQRCMRGHCRRTPCRSVRRTGLRTFICQVVADRGQADRSVARINCETKLYDVGDWGVNERG